MGVIKRPMLAPPELPKTINFPVLATPKLDGIRCLRVDGRTLSRKFKDIPNRHIQQLFALLPEGVDGEIMIDGKPFNEISSAVMSEDGEPSVVFEVFDYVKSSLSTPYRERMEHLRALPLPAFCRKLLPRLIHSEEELNEYMAECLAAGFEGVMIRDPEGPYKCGRSTAIQGWLLKLKEWEDSEAEIIDFVEYMHNENEATIDELGHTKRSQAKAGLVPAGMLGKLMVREVGDRPWKGEVFGVGTGYDFKQRQEIWDNRDKYMGKIITYKYQKRGIKDVPRFPVWKGIRSPLDMS